MHAETYAPRVPSPRELPAPPLLLRPWQAARDADAVLRAVGEGLMSLADPTDPEPPDLLAAAQLWCVGGTAWLGVQRHWAITLADRPRDPIGAIALHRIEPAHGSAEVGYWLFPEARGHGYAAIALAAVTRAAVTELGLFRLLVEHEPDNLASCRTAERAGYARREQSGGGHVHTYDGGLAVHA